MVNQRVLITGANGFVGQALCPHLIDAKFTVRKALRRKLNHQEQEDCQIVGDIDANTDWAQALDGIDSVVHLAARAHVMNEFVSDPLSEYRKVNVAGTANLAQQAARAKVRRFIFVSSIKVNGEKTEDRRFTESDEAAPQDAYGISKWEAEQSLLQIAKETGLEVVILRPPLIYGPAVKANFYQLINTIYRGLPLPLGKVRNQRSLLYVRTFADAIKACLTHPNASGKTFLVSDEKSLSTPDLITKLAGFLQCSPRLLNVPLAWMKIGGTMLGKAAVIDKLTSSLVIDDSKIRQELNWSSPYTIELGMQKTAEWFLANRLRLGDDRLPQDASPQQPIIPLKTVRNWQVESHPGTNRYKV